MMATLQRAAGLLQAGQVGAAIGLLDQVLADHPEQADALLLRAMARSRAGEDDAATADFEAAARCHPKTHLVDNNRGNHHRRAGRLSAAVEAYEAALVRAPDYLDARMNLALSLAAMAAFEPAEAALDAVLVQQPGHAGALNELGNLKRRQGDLAAAEDAFDRAIAGDANAPFPLINRGSLLRELGRLDASRVDLEAACRLVPGLAEAHAQLAHTLRTQRDVTGAELAYRRALALAPLDPGHHADLASLLSEAGRGPSALATLENAAATSGDARLHEVLARALLRSGRPADARAAAQAALTRDPASVEAPILLSELALRSGDAADAVAQARRAWVSGGPDDWPARHALAEALLVSKAWQEVVDLLDTEAPAPHLQKHLALQSVAWRLADDPRYRQLCDYDRFARKLKIDTPVGFESLAAFNAALSESIRRLHADGAAPLEQTLFGGTQSPGRLWNSDDPVIRALAAALEALAARYLAELPVDNDHPFLGRNTGRAKLAGAWSVRLRSGGGHVDHVHPAGWVSASYYVQVPESVMAGERAGWLRLGVPGLPGLALPAERYIKPEPGHAIVFPSFFWHGVEAFESDEVRVTAPFDLLPD